jgi:aminoglycoside phosphotransferase (APT) family kinase protein
MADAVAEVTAQRATEYLQENVALLDALEIDLADSRELQAMPLATGEHNANFTFVHPRTHAKHVLRVNYISQLGLDDQIGYEYRALEFLEPSGCTPRARFCDSSKQLDGHGALVMDFYEGEWLDYGKPEQVERAAHMLADVHAVDTTDACPLLRPGNPLKKQLEKCAGFFKAYRSSAFEDPIVSKVVGQMFREAERAVEQPLDPADSVHALNTEAVASHFLIASDDEPGHFVDWEMPLVGEAAQDVAYFLSPTTTIWDTEDRFIFSAAERDAFVEMYWRSVNGRFAPGRFEQRFDAYVKTNCLVGITWSANAWVEYHDPARPLKSERTYNLLQEYLNPAFLERCYDICFSPM